MLNQSYIFLQNVPNLEKRRWSIFLRGFLLLIVSMQSNSSQQACTAEWSYGPGGAVTWPWCEERGQGDTACIYMVFPRPKPYSLSHLWMPPPFLTDFPDLPSGASDTVIFPEQSETPVFPLGHPWLSAYLSVNFFPLSPLISSLIPYRFNRISNHSCSSSLCFSFRPLYDGPLPYCHIA